MFAIGSCAAGCDSFIVKRFVSEPHYSAIGNLIRQETYARGLMSPGVPLKCVRCCPSMGLRRTLPATS